MAEIPEWLPGEPRRAQPPAPLFVLRLLLRSVQVLLVATLTAPLWPLFWVSVLVWGAPPNVPRPAQILRYLGHVFSARPPAPGMGVLARAWMLLNILFKVASVPFWGLCWQLDELLYGEELRRNPVVAPLIEISAARSGSTQLARYLEEDPELAAPALLQFFFPFLWMWRLAPHTIGRFIGPDDVRRKITEMMPSEFLERHEGDPFRTDTFDGVVFINHLNGWAPFFGPALLEEDFSFARAAPHNRALWEEIFPQLLEGIGRKTLAYAGPRPDGRPRRFFVKGHFLCDADALERRFPDARFLTMIREPAPRLQSGINFLRANPVDDTMGPMPWVWLAQGLGRTEVDYCEIEQAWFTRAGGARRCVVRFNDYVRDLEGAMTQVYRDCLDRELPAEAPRQHPPRERTRYQLNRSLEQLGVDEAALKRRLEGYIAWCRG